MPDAQTLKLISPELILSAFGILILLFDLVFRERGHGIVPWIAILGFVLAMLATLDVWFVNQPLFANTYVVDTFSNFFKLIATISGIIITLISIDYLRGRTASKGDFFALFTFAVLAMVLMASSSSLLMIYLSIEFLSYTSYLLTGFMREDKKSNEAAIKYFLYGAITSAVMLYGLSILYGLTGTLNLTEIAFKLASTADNSIREATLAAFVLILAGVGFKISLVPFHQWAPDAYEGAPTPVTAFLSVGPKAAGFAVLLRLALTALPALKPDWSTLLGTLSIATMTLGNLIAIQQSNVKRMLAYSSIAQAGYMLIGLVGVNNLSANPLPVSTGLNGVLIYIAAYLFTNLGAFICVVAIENATGAVEIPQYAGMIRRAPFLAAMLVLFFLSLAGIPPTAGFIGKFFVFAAALKEGFLLLAAIGVVNSVVSVFYYFNIARAMFFLDAKDPTPIRATWVVNSALVISAAAVLLIAFFPQPLFDIAQVSMAMLGVTK